MHIGVAGVGKLGEFHTNLLKQIASENPDVELSGVFDLNPERLQEIGKKYDVHCFGSLAEMADTCDAAVIATTNSSHYVIAKQLLEAGLSLFIEKPITTTLEEADELIRIEKEKGLTIQVGHIERFNP
ncbi:MAG TPA: gfo/Idh/MocA family oxidoreductase, partial [Chlorobaculum parvum]|nr:gfo/Idh/MocA family oxidoreductase [Chlorobaculum parvum]